MASRTAPRLHGPDKPKVMWHDTVTWVTATHAPTRRSPDVHCTRSSSRYGHGMSACKQATDAPTQQQAPCTRTRVRLAVFVSALLFLSPFFLFSGRIGFHDSSYPERRGGRERKRETGTRAAGAGGHTTQPAPWRCVTPICIRLQFTFHPQRYRTRRASVRAPATARGAKAKPRTGSIGAWRLVALVSPPPARARVVTISRAPATPRMRISWRSCGWGGGSVLDACASASARGRASRPRGRGGKTRGCMRMQYSEVSTRGIARIGKVVARQCRCCVSLLSK